MTVVDSRSGQVLLLTMLAITVASTIVLSLVGRSRVNLQIATDVEESTRAFNAAEAGIEEILLQGTPRPTGIDVDTNAQASYRTESRPFGQGTAAFTIPGLFEAGQSATVWLAAHNVDGSLNQTTGFGGGAAANLAICFRGIDGNQPAVIATVFFRRAVNDYSFDRYMIDPNAARRLDNKFNVPAAGGYGGNCNLPGSTVHNISLPGGASIPLMLRVRGLYSDFSLAVDPRGTPIAQQGYDYVSEGKTPSGVTRKVRVYKEYFTPHDAYDAVLYSETNLTK